MSSRLSATAALLLATACASGPSAPPSPVSTARCGPAQGWDGSACRPLSADREKLDAAVRELVGFKAEEAAVLLEAARREGPYRHDDHVRLYEKLGVAYAYLDDEARALAAFDMVLALEPGHAISYTLSPKVTFLFEKARKNAQTLEPPLVRVSWPRELRVDEPIPFEVEVLADRKSFLRRARLHTKNERDGSGYRFVDFDLAAPGSYERVVIPAPAPESSQDEVVNVYLTAFDSTGNEVLLWGDASRPRDVTVRHEAESPWYAKWWVWGIAGGVAAVTTGAIVFAATREPPDQVDGRFSAR